MNLIKSCRRNWDCYKQVLKGDCVFVYRFQGFSCTSAPSLHFLSKTIDSAEKYTGFAMENPCSQLSSKEKEQDLSYSQILNTGTRIRKQNYFQAVSRGEGRKRNCAKGKTWAEYQRTV